MRDFNGKTYWLIGASEGLGRALAHRLSRRGARVVLSARDEARLTALAAELPGRAQVMPLDVGDLAAVERAAGEIGSVDGLVYLAGVYAPMTAAQWDSAHIAQTLDINLVGATRAIGAVLPQMMARGAGHIVLTGSLAAYRGLPGAMGYGASKAGLMSLAETLDLELRGSGVLVQIAHPGFIRTRLTAQNDFAMPQIMEPERAAEHMMQQMVSDRFAVSFPAPFSWLLRSTQLWPKWLYTAVMGRWG